MRPRAFTKRCERFTGIVQAIAHIGAEMAGTALDAFEVGGWGRWLAEPDIEIISEASRRLRGGLESASLEDDCERNLRRCSRSSKARTIGGGATPLSITTDEAEVKSC